MTEQDVAFGIPPEQTRPLYARLLGLRHLNPGGLLCFCFFEGAFVLGALFALAELIAWWGVPVLPATIAVMVKLNDVVAGAVTRSAVQVAEREQERFRLQVTPVVGRAAVPRTGAGAPPTTGGRRDEVGRPATAGPGAVPLRRHGEAPGPRHVEAAGPPWRNPVDSPRQRSRHAATGRDE